VTYEALVLDSSRVADPSGPEVEQALYEAAAACGLQAFDDVEAIENFVQRWAYAAKLDARVPPPPDGAGLAGLRAACDGRRSFAELRTAGVLPSLRALCPGPAAGLIEGLCPEHVALGSGRRLRVSYEPDRPPWVQSRLQDFFGLRDGPRLGKEPLVLHLLAPNQRAVQVTTDLAGFWQRHYPELRRQLMRRYPRHSWPEDPLTAAPPAPKR
jgi:ATP-dependent helicase HrpB